MSSKDNKRYYWLKLEEDFFDDDTIQWIKDREGGEKYVLFYLTLCLKSLKWEGSLLRFIGDMIIPYDVNALAKLTDTEPDTVRVALELFRSIGLIEMKETGEIYMNQIDEMVGSETGWAKRKRIQRIKLENVQQLSTECPPEIEIDKSKEIRVKRIDKEIEITEEIDIPAENGLDVVPLDSENETLIEKTESADDSFDIFWAAYPKKVDKKATRSAWKRIKKKDIPIIMEALEVHKKQQQWKNPKHIKGPAAWLNGEKWNDEIILDNNDLPPEERDYTW